MYIYTHITYTHNIQLHGKKGDLSGREICRFFWFLSKEKIKKTNEKYRVRFNKTINNRLRFSCLAMKEEEKKKES